MHGAECDEADCLLMSIGMITFRALIRAAMRI
jgi:hypothetical protein